MRWLITEKCDYLVSADTAAEAEELFERHAADGASGTHGVEFLSVGERLVEPANLPGEGA